MEDVLLHLHNCRISNNNVTELRRFDFLYDTGWECSFIPESISIPNPSKLITHNGNTRFAKNTARNPFLSLNADIRVNVINGSVCLSNLVIFQFLS